MAEARDQYSLAFKQKVETEKNLEEMKNLKKEVDIELKYLKEREDSLKRKIEGLEEELSNSRNRPAPVATVEVNQTEVKTEAFLSFQSRFSEIESMLSLKTQEGQSMAIEIDRLRYELQRF